MGVEGIVAHTCVCVIKLSKQNLCCKREIASSQRNAFNKKAMQISQYGGCAIQQSNSHFARECCN